MSCYLGQSRHLCATTLPLYRRARSGVLFSLEISAALGLFAAARAMTARPNDPAHSPPKEPNARKRRDKDIQT